MKKLAILFLMTLAINVNAQLTDIVTGLNDPTSIAIYGDDMYIAGLRTVSKINLQDPNPAPVDILTDINNGAHLLVHGDDLYIGLFSGGKVMKIDLSSNDTTPIDLVADVHGVNGLFIKDNFLYIAESTENKISRADLSETNPISIDFVTNVGFPNGLFIEGNELYFIEVRDDKISKVDLTQANPSPVDVITGLDGVSFGLTVIGDELYFSYYGEDKIAKINSNDSNPLITDVVTNVKNPAQLLYKDNELFVAIRDDNKVTKINTTVLSVPDIAADLGSHDGSKISLSPNPATNTITLTGFKGSQNGILHDITGKKIFDFTAKENEALDLQQIASGIYYVILDNGWSQKVIKK